MKSKDIREMTDQELAHALEETRRERFNLRVQAKTGQLQNSARLSQVRRDIARIKTEANARQRAAAGA